MTRHFVHHTLGQTVRFATGSAAPAVEDAANQFRAQRIMVVTSHRDADRAQRITAQLPVVHTHRDTAMHVPIETAERGRAAATQHGADALVCIGGGSTTGLAKAIALTHDIPIIAVPTTYAGSEATDVWGVTEGSVKTTGSDPRVLPRCVVYDAELATSLPVALSVASGLNALAHCVDSLWAPRADPIATTLATEGIRVLAAGLPLVVDAPGDLDGREQTFYGGYLSAVAFAAAGSGLHHKICHVLGGRYDLPHAQTHSVVLPYVLALNATGAPDAERRIARAFGCATAMEGLDRLRTRTDAPRALSDYGFEESMIADAAEAVLPLVPASNPVPVTLRTLTNLLRSAWEGSDPDDSRH